MNFHTALCYLHPSVHPVQALFDPQSRTYERYLQQQEHHIRSWKEPWQTLTASVAAAAAWRDWLSTLDTHKLEDRIHLLGLKRRTGPLCDTFSGSQQALTHRDFWHSKLPLTTCADFRFLREKLIFWGGLKLVPCSTDMVRPVFHGNACLHFKILKVQS